MVPQLLRKPLRLFQIPVFAGLLKSSICDLRVVLQPAVLPGGYPFNVQLSPVFIDEADRFDILVVSEGEEVYKPLIPVTVFDDGLVVFAFAGFLFDSPFAHYPQGALDGRVWEFTDQHLVVLSIARLDFMSLRYTRKFRNASVSGPPAGAGFGSEGFPVFGNLLHCLPHNK